ncbi:MAG: SCO family protein [Planctomycetes bacterium]|nr:SCO family protein [Planctomycetota bacterium]
MFRFPRALQSLAFTLAGCTLTFVGLCTAPAVAQEYVDDENRYPILNQVGVDEKLDAQVPGDVSFRDLDENAVQLGDFFKGDRTVVLTLNYATCPKLCGLQLAGIAEALGATDLEPGEDYTLVTISLNPYEKAEAARAVLQGFLAKFGRDVDTSAWHFLRGPEANIRQVADAVGFRYVLDPESGEYAHPPTAMVLSPEGKVCRYVNGFTPDPKTLRLSIKEASLGQSGSTYDKLLFFCFSFDSSTGKYTLAAWRLLRTAGVLTVFGIVTGIWMLQRSRRREESQ